MSDEETPQGGPPPNRSFTGLWFFLFAFVPLPLGLLTLNPERLGNLIIGGERTQNASIYERFFVVLIVACSITGCIGMFGGFKRSNWDTIGLGILLGLCLAVVQGLILSFLGCCQILSHI